VTAITLRPVVVATTAGWALLIATHVSGTGHALHVHHSPQAGTPVWAALLLFVVAWPAMVAAMMLPAMLPWARLLAARAQGGFLIGYTALWTGFGALAVVGTAASRRAVGDVPWLAARPWLVTASFLGVAGAFQLSRSKQRCLSRCCAPAPRLLAGAGFRLGCEYGVLCLGCCWALMLLMLAAGVASLWWMAALTVLMVYERVGQNGRRAARLAGIVLLVAAVLQIARPAVLGDVNASAAGTTIGPGPVHESFHAGRYRIELRISPNRAAASETIVLELRDRGRAVNGAGIRARFTMLDMDMGEVSTLLRQIGPGTYAASSPPLPMSGRWSLRLELTPAGAASFALDIVDELAVYR
jgi:predicted metal-binding membrane protein